MEVALRRIPRQVCALLLLSGTISAARAASAGGENVNVLLFHTEPVKQLQLRSDDARMRLCSACNEQRGPVSVRLSVQGSAIVVDGQRAVRDMELNGSVEATTQSGLHASVAGRWKIGSEGGQLRVSVEVSRERYVEAVLAAEANPADPAESLKALAVSVRTFAAAAPPRHVGGSLCDSTHCQALRFGPVQKTIHDAAWSTSGEMLWLGGRRVPAYFSQHCGGFSEGAKEAWGGERLPWLTAHTDVWCARVPSQWRASLAEADVRRALAAEGYPLPDRIARLTVVDRDQSGRVRKIRLDAGASSVGMTASTLRFAVNRTLGWNQLRSDRYEVQRVGDRIVFSGSGFGHGVGLCQAGATQMAEAGKTYRDILREYFPGTVVRVGASDSGWVATATTGFRLRTTVPDPTIQNDVARAFAEARSRWSGSVTHVPTISIYPSTELFRQDTGQPGWDVATARGDRIAVQPAAILRAHGGIVPVLRHEFLHSFVEEESSAAAPLWLREGLVAVLNNDSCASAVHQAAAKIDASLTQAGSLAEAQQAHAAACGLVRQSISQRGFSATRAMLQAR